MPETVPQTRPVSTAAERRKVRHVAYPAFDIFRGIGILFVIVGHTPYPHPVIDALRPLGALGVHMFFAFSGFLITSRLVEEFEQTGKVEMGQFYRRRARRILPPALIYLATLLLLGPGLHILETGFDELAASLLFYRNLYQPPVESAWYTAHFWTLSLEEQFYLTWPLILIAVGVTSRRARFAAIAVIGATVLWRLYVFSVDPAANIYRTDLLADHLMWGCLLGLFAHTIRIEIPILMRRTVGVAGILLATFLLYLQPWWWQAPFACSLAVGFVFLACSFSGGGDRESKLTWGVRQLGLASYDCYLWQSLFLPLPLAAAATLPWTQRAPWSYLLIAIFTTISFRLTFPRSRRRAAER